MEAAHACEDTEGAGQDYQSLANEVESIVDGLSDGGGTTGESHTWEEIELVDEADDTPEAALADTALADTTEGVPAPRRLKFIAIKEQLLQVARAAQRQHQPLSFTAGGLQQVTKAGEKLWTELVKHVRFLIAVVRGTHNGSIENEDAIGKDRAATLLVMVKRALQSFDGHTYISSKLSLFRSLVTNGLVAEADIDEAYKAVRSLRASWAVHLILKSYYMYDDIGRRGHTRQDALPVSWDDMRSRDELQFDYVAQRETVVVPGLKQALTASSGTTASAAPLEFLSDGGAHVLLTLFDASHRGLIALSSNNKARQVQDGETPNFISIVTGNTQDFFDRTYMPTVAAGAGFVDEVLGDPSYYESLADMPQHERTKLFKCPIAGCSQSFTSQAGLDRHVNQTQHASSGPVDRPFKCPIAGCSQSFPSQAGVNRHVKQTHTTLKRKASDMSMEEEDMNTCHAARAATVGVAIGVAIVVPVVVPMVVTPPQPPPPPERELQR